MLGHGDFNSFPASVNFCRLLITLANSLEPDRARQNVGPDLDPNCLTLMEFLKDFFEKGDLKKNPQTTKKKTKKKNMQNYPACKELVRRLYPLTPIHPFQVQHYLNYYIALDKSGYPDNIFLISPQNICCGYTLEVPHGGASSGTH